MIFYLGSDQFLIENLCRSGFNVYHSSSLCPKASRFAKIYLGPEKFAPGFDTHVFIQDKTLTFEKSKILHGETVSFKNREQLFWELWSWLTFEYLEEETNPYPNGNGRAYSLERFSLSYLKSLDLKEVSLLRI